MIADSARRDIAHLLPDIVWRSHEACDVESIWMALVAKFKFALSSPEREVGRQHEGT